MSTQVYPRSRQQDIVTQDLGKEILLYDLKKHKAFSLNETSALVWQECDGKQDISQISQIISRKLKLPANEDLVWLTIDELKKENLLENEAELVSVFSGMSRREVIRKVGLGTMIALPIISTLVAPSAASAQSGVQQEGGPCMSDADCDPTAPGPLACCLFGTDGFCFSLSDGDCGATN